MTMRLCWEQSEQEKERLAFALGFLGVDAETVGGMGDG